ncbi:ABC transporter permease [Vannielia litorea]|uniref:ABC transporter permease n=1 Tax=Vannielia litorea TaxID=1217970 RepID=UPI001BCD5AE5|nr:ABC transporter permease [Vannielia litorea]MBS8227338.1 ABC transporter permease [Vannielia litorea]
MTETPSKALPDQPDEPLAVAEAHTPDEVAIASQWQLTWWAFKKHRLAMIGLWVIGFMYLVSLFAGFVAPNDPTDSNRRAVYHPPQMIHFIDSSEDGWSFRPYVWEMDRERDPDTLAVTYVPSGEKIYLRLFGRGQEYKFWGLWETDIHLLATVKPRDNFFLFGADRLGRDMFSRVVYGTRISMSIGLVGVAIALVLGITLGGISGYYGGRTDTVIQRLIEFVLSLPTIPIWLALAAALPPSWPIYQQYFVITLIVSLVGWTELGRVVRGRFLAMKNDDFVIAARLDGASEKRIIFRHMLPSLTSHIIASLTLAIPLMILAETGLSFLGLGLQPPAISWGVLLKEAQNIRSISQAPWLFIPGGFVVVAVLAFNFLGDGMRDAADPYGH